MALDGLIDKLLVTGKDGKVTPSDYDAKSFASAYRQVEQLGSLNLQSEADIKKYAELTGDDPKSLSPDKLRVLHEARVKGMNKDLSSYVDANFAKASGTIDEDSIAQLALKYLPQNSTGDAKSSYEVARSSIFELNLKAKAIQEDKDKYFDTMLGGVKSDCMKRYMKEYKDAFLRIEIGEIGSKVSSILESYGPARFLVDSFKSIKQQSKTLADLVDKQQKEANENLATARRTLKKKNLSAAEVAQIISGVRAKYDAQMKASSDGAKYDKIIEEIAEESASAFEVAEKKKAEEEKAKMKKAA